MHAALLTVGDELLIGQVVDTNAAWMGARLNGIGVCVERMVTVGDDATSIITTLRELQGDVDLVLITGGLGPTHDDVTKKAVAEFAGTRLVPDPEVLAHLQARFSRRGRPFSPAQAVMAEVPEGFEVLPNSAGAAPGLWYTVPGTRPLHLALMPGVPYEMQVILKEHVVPRLQAMGGILTIRQAHLLTAGAGESDLADKIGDLGGLLDASVKLAYLPNAETGVRLRLTAQHESAAVAAARLAALETHIRSKIGRYIYGAEDDTLEGVVGQMLAARGLTIALAESCTGGLLADRLTNVPGSSGYVVGGVVAYANRVKEQVLGVSAEVLETYGAVSEEVARHMAQGVRQRLGADIGISTTGIAGPGGGTPEKPVGLVWFGYADARGTYTKCLRLTHQRRLNKVLTSMLGLNIIRLQLAGDLRVKPGPTPETL